MNLRLIILCGAALLAIFSSMAFARNDDIDKDMANMGFEDVPYSEDASPYFGVGGGYTGTFLFPNFDKLNKLFESEGFGLDPLEGFVYVHGGEGFLPTFFVDNLRVSFYGMGGSKLIEAVVDVSGEDMTRSVDYKVSLTGTSIDYAFIPFKGFAIIPGVSLGIGSLTVDAFQGDEFDWGNISTTQDPNNWMFQLSSGFWFAQPRINVEGALTDFLTVRGSVGYSMTFGYDWKYNRSSKLSNAPDIEATGLTLQFGVFLGLFNY